MRTIIIVLLLAAAGAGAYFYFSKKSNHVVPTSKELIVGQWEMDSVDVSKSKDSNSLFLAFFMQRDSTGHRSKVEFSKEGKLLVNPGSTHVDTNFFKVETDSSLLVWSSGDSVKSKWNIKTLDSSRLVVRDQDSMIISLKKIGR